MSSRSSSKLGHLVSKTRSPGQISRKLCYNHFELWSECLPWSVLDQALKVLCCSGERYRAIMALLFFFRYFFISQKTADLTFYAIENRIWHFMQWRQYAWNVKLKNEKIFQNACWKILLRVLCWTVFLTERIPHTCEKFGRICHAAWRIRPNFSQLPNVFLTYLWQTSSVSVLYIARKRICHLSKKKNSKKCLFFMHGFLTNVFVTAYDIKHTINHLIQFRGNIFFLSCISFNRVIDLLFILLLFLTYYWIS